MTDAEKVERLRAALFSFMDSTTIEELVDMEKLMKPLADAGHGDARKGMEAINALKETA